MPVEPRRAIRTRDRKHSIGAEAQPRGKELELDASRALLVPQQCIGCGERHTIHHTRATDAVTAQTQPAEILDRVERRHLKHLDHFSIRSTRKRMRSPSDSRLGGSFARSKGTGTSGARPIVYQPVGCIAGPPSTWGLPRLAWPPPIDTLPPTGRISGTLRRGVKRRGSSPKR